MKQTFILLFVSMAFLFVACGPTQDQAVKHNDAIVADQKALLNVEDELLDLVFDASADFSEVTAKHQEYNTMIATLLDKYEKMAAFDDQDIFRLAMIDFVKSFKGISENQFKTFIDIISSVTEENQYEVQGQIEALATEIDDLEAKTLEVFLKKQEEFATQYGFTLM